MSNLDVWQDYSKFKFREFLEVLRNTFVLSSTLNLLAIIFFASYFFVNLSMADKIFTFLISGKIVGTSYTLSFEQACIISGTVVASLLAISIYRLIRADRNNGYIKLKSIKNKPVLLKVNIGTSLA